MSIDKEYALYWIENNKKLLIEIRSGVDIIWKKPIKTILPHKESGFAYQ